ncbi:MAG: Uma2 family endonuclease [Anaerolineae bacterium]|nr:Uma2 family endonuclease [Anaerolineae bacterium]
MMVFQSQIAPITVAQLQEQAAFPENADKLLELIDGEIVEKMPGSTRNSTLAFNMGFFVQTFCQKNNIPCYVSIGDGAYSVNGNVLAPDFAYKQTPMADEYPDPVSPLWAIEVISPNDKASEIRKKRLKYLEADILYWEMYPQSRSIDVYAPGQTMRTIGIDGILDGGAVLPDFKVSAKDLWGK